MGLFRDLLRRTREAREDAEKARHMGTVGMERELDHGGLSIKIIKAQNGNIIEYTSRDDEKENQALAHSARNAIVDRGPFSRKLYIVPEGVKIADAVMAVIALMRLE